MPSTFRIPKAEIRGLYGKALAAYARRTYGQVPDNAYVYGTTARRSGRSSRSSRRWRSSTASTANLKSYAQAATAGEIGCSWCLDFGYFLAHNDGLDLAKVREVMRWRDSDAFSPVEREVLAYAEAMSTTPLTVTDEMVAGLVEPPGLGGRRRAHPDGGAGEQARALQLRCRACRARATPTSASLPLAVPVRRGVSADGRLRSAPQPAVHGGLRDARLGRRRRGRAPGDLAALGGRRPRRGPRRARLPGADHHPALPQPAAHARAPPGGPTSARGCPSRCSPPPTSPRTSSWPTASRRPCCWCWRRSARPSGRCSCSARSSTSGTTRSRPPWTSRRPRSARSRTGRASTSRPGGRARR